MTIAALYHSFGCGICFLGTVHEKIATQHCSFLFLACCIIKNLVIQALGDKRLSNKTSLLNSAHAEVGN